MAFVVTVANVKGGVGKTSTAIALGSSLAQEGFQVLLIDMDAQADLTTGIGLAPATTSYGARNLLIPGFTEQFPITRMIRKTGFDNLYVIPSDGDIGWHEHNLPGADNQSALILANTLEKLTIPDFDFIVIDCPPAASAYILTALSAADLLIIPTQAEYFSANSLIKMIRLARQVRQETNPKLTYRVLVTMLDTRSGIQKKVFEEFRQGFKSSIFPMSIEIDTKLRESQQAHVPITHFIPEARSAQRYTELAKEILATMPRMEMESFPITPKEVEAKQSKVRCPFFGIRDDASTSLDYPDPQNLCYRAIPNASPKISHQTSHCLAEAYVTCPMLATDVKKPLPDALKASPPSFWSKFKS